jgi:hypothetical protein
MTRRMIGFSCGQGVERIEFVDLAAPGRHR